MTTYVDEVCAEVIVFDVQPHVEFRVVGNWPRDDISGKLLSLDQVRKMDRLEAPSCDHSADKPSLGSYDQA